MAEPIALVAEQLSVELGGRCLLQPLEFAADFGVLTAVLGPNGAGKSTLLRALSGLLPSGGRIALCGRELAALTPRERSRLLAFVPQRSQLGARLPVFSVVSQGRFAHRRGLSPLSPRDLAAMESAMARADVLHLSEREFPELSQGEQRRVLLARALASEARVLLLDEPAASLDIPHALALYATLRALCADGHCVVAVMHQLDDALRLTDRALLLSSGQSIAQGPSPEVLSAANIERVFGVQLVPGGALGFRLRGAGASEPP